MDKVITALIDGEEVEFTNSIQFNKANIQSKITYKFVLDNGATLKALPKVIINKGASNINTHLSIKCLILDSKSRASVTPSLEIFEDNVKAGHGASIGALDKNQIYTLIKAGIKREVAVKILVKAFLT